MTKIKQVLNNPKSLNIAIVIITIVFIVAVCLPFQKMSVYDNESKETIILQQRLITSQYMLLAIFIALGYIVALILSIFKKKRETEVLLFVLSVISVFLLLFMIVEFMKNRYANGKISVGISLFLYPIVTCFITIFGLEGINDGTKVNDSNFTKSETASK